MCKLFPSSSATKFPRLSEAFDPTGQCVANRWQKQKASPRLKPSKITFVLVNRSAKGIPRGRHMKALENSNCVLKVNVVRSMTAKEINRAVFKAFEHHLKKSFQYLSVNCTLHFKVDEDQEKDSNMVVERGAKGKIYIKELLDMSLLVLYHG